MRQSNKSTTPSKNKDRLTVWKANRFLFLTQDYNPDFSDEEIDELCIHCSNRDFNQFFYIIIRRVLDHKQFGCDNHTVIQGLLVKYDKFDFGGLPLKSVETLWIWQPFNTNL